MNKKVQPQFNIVKLGCPCRVEGEGALGGHIICSAKSYGGYEDDNMRRFVGACFEEKCPMLYWIKNFR